MEINFQLLMLSPNLLKSQIPMSSVGRGGGGVVGGNQFPTSDAESKFVKKKKKKFFCEKLCKFSGKKVPGNGSNTRTTKICNIEV